jgi:hypothetical protein
MSIPAQQAAKITRPLMPAAAPAVLLLSLGTQQGVPSIILAMTRRDFGKPAFSLRKKTLRENTCTIASGLLDSCLAADVKLGHDAGRREIGMMQLIISGLVKDFAERHRDLLQMGKKVLVFGCRESVEKMVLSRIIEFSHMQSSCLFVG